MGRRRSRHESARGPRRRDPALVKPEHEDAQLTTAEACDRCLRRSWLVARLAGHLDQVRGRFEEVLALGDDDLLAATGGRDVDGVRRELERVAPDDVRAQAKAAALEMVCRCAPAYPAALRELAAPPAVLHVAGGLERLLALMARDPVAIVGARRCTDYGSEVARGLARELGRSGVTVVSGMARGIDSAAHAGALAAGAPTVAVLPGSAHRPYPAAKRALHRQIIATGAAVSEVPPGAGVWRWMFPARNRIIAALSALTVVVEAGYGSGALITARMARALGRPVAAVPGRVTTPAAAGSNDLLAGGAYAVRGAQDVLDHLFGVGVRRAVTQAREELSPDLARVLSAVAGGRDTPAALAGAGFTPEEGLAALAALELSGYIRRGAGGRFSVLP